MALTRKFLAALGIDADKVDEIIDAHTESINALKEQRDEYKADAEKLPAVQKELDELKENNGDGYEAKYKELKKEYDDYKAEVAEKELKAKKESAYREILKDAGIGENHIAKVLKYTDWATVELEDDGKIKEAKNHIKSIKEEWPELIVTTSQKGADTHNPPEGSGKTYGSKEEIMKIADAGERQKAIADNHELFGF